MVGRLGLAEHLGRHADLSEREHAPAHVREMLEELGPTFVKLGQVLSTRPDIVPEAYIDELSKLQDTAPTVPFDEIKEVMEKEFAAPISDLYRECRREPIAAASLGQAHRARLRMARRLSSRSNVPNIQEVVETDIEILLKRAQFLEHHYARARIYGIADLVDEFAMTIREEMDYTREGRNTDRLRQNLANQHHVLVPVVYWDLTTSKVLTLQEMQGRKITDIACDPSSRCRSQGVSNRLASSFMQQIFVDGFFHADPHPGNILVTDSGNIALSGLRPGGQAGPGEPRRGRAHAHGFRAAGFQGACG